MTEKIDRHSSTKAKPKILESSCDVQLLTQSWIPVSSTGMTEKIDRHSSTKAKPKILESSCDVQLLTQSWIPVSSTGMTEIVVIPVRSETKILESSCVVLFEDTILDARVVALVHRSRSASFQLTTAGYDDPCGTRSFRCKAKPQATESCEGHN
jgi:hypothetical protein